MSKCVTGGAALRCFLWLGLAAAFLAPPLAAACTPDALGNTDNGTYAVQSSGVLEAVQAQSAYPFSMGSVSVNVYQIVSGTAQLDVAFYSDAGGLPGTLLAQGVGGPQAAVLGWNTFAMPALTYSAGTYWLAFQASNPNVYFTTDLNATPSVNITQTNVFGSFPATWTNNVGLNNLLWSDYAQICSDLSSPTPTSTATVQSPTSSPSPTPSATLSATPTGTASPSATQTPPPTPTPSFSASATPSWTASPTPSPTLSASASPSPTWPPSRTPSFSATPSAFISATPTASPRPSRTASPSPTSTPTPMPSLTPACASGPVWPNPFTPTLGTNQAVQFCVAPGHPAGTLLIYTLKRRLIRSLVVGPGQPVAWDGRDSQGSVVQFGVYPFLLQCGGRVERGAVTVLR
jgi:hypothetical protein